MRKRSIRRLTSRGSPSSRRAADVSPLITNPAIMQFNLCSGAYIVHKRRLVELFRLRIDGC
ncbi:MAG TPA: hypothetical protein PLY87_27060, partial [Planctomycetaceae bacterium]|nr:hypothetical protein [Planctomycetaceae bacterium]